VVGNAGWCLRRRARVTVGEAGREWSPGASGDDAGGRAPSLFAVRCRILRSALRCGATLALHIDRALL
jgi:hypothetical protein